MCQNPVVKLTVSTSSLPPLAMCLILRLYSGQPLARQQLFITTCCRGRISQRLGTVGSHHFPIHILLTLSPLRVNPQPPTKGLFHQSQGTQQTSQERNALLQYTIRLNSTSIPCRVQIIRQFINHLRHEFQTRPPKLSTPRKWKTICGGF